MPTIVFHVGGAYHDTVTQAEAIIGWLGDTPTCQMYDGAAAFAALGEADLLVLMGMHWPGMMHPSVGSLPYQPLRAAHKVAFERYVASGRPLLIHHAAIFSYSDWPRFGELLGFWWDWQRTRFAPPAEYRVFVNPTGHPVVEGVGDYLITDELYIDVQVTPGLNAVGHAEARIQDERKVRGNGHSPAHRQPLVWTAEGGRAEGAGRLVYLANGHDMRAFACPALRQLWINAVAWLLGDA